MYIRENAGKDERARDFLFIFIKDLHKGHTEYAIALCQHESHEIFI